MNQQPEQPWLDWAMELQFIAQAGITYSKDPFDLERFQRIRELSVEIMAHKTGFSPEHIKSVFCNEVGYQTPKLDSRAAIFRNGKILLVKERDGRWALPGGWVDVMQSVRSNVIKEVKEEAGLDVEVTKLIALLNRKNYNKPDHAYGIMIAFLLCEVKGGSFTQNIETQDSDYFALDNLPPLAEEKTTYEQIKICFDGFNSPNWKTLVE